MMMYVGVLAALKSYFVAEAFLEPFEVATLACRLKP